MFDLPERNPPQVEAAIPIDIMQLIRGSQLPPLQ